MEQRENIQLLKHKDQSLQCIYQEQFGGPSQSLKYGLKENESGLPTRRTTGKKGVFGGSPNKLVLTTDTVASVL